MKRILITAVASCRGAARDGRRGRPRDGLQRAGHGQGGHAHRPPRTPPAVPWTATEGPGHGPVWAYDNMSKQFAVTRTSDGNYTVVETVHGSFQAFSEPNTGLVGPTRRST